MVKINLDEIIEFQKEIESSFEKRQVSPSFCLGNDYSLSFVYEKYIDVEIKANFKALLIKWYEFISFMLLLKPDLNSSTKSFIISLYNSVENSFLLINFLRTSSSFAVLRGVYESLLKIAFELRINGNYDISTKDLTLIKIKDLRSRISQDPLLVPFDQKFEIVFDAYGQLCKHSHINVLQQEQIIQEEYINRLIGRVNESLRLHAKVINLLIYYYLLLDPESFYKINNVSFSTTDLMRRDKDTFYWGISAKFFYYKNLPNRIYQNYLSYNLTFNPVTESERFNLANVFLKSGQIKKANELFKTLIETKYLENNNGYYFLFLLCSKLANDEDTTALLTEKLKPTKIPFDYLKSLFEEYMKDNLMVINEILKSFGHPTL